jgi:glucose-1-phosphate thymidylyltransferase
LVRADEQVLVGLPDTVWFPRHGYRLLPEEGLSFLCFPVDRPELFDAVVSDDTGRVQAIQVKQSQASSDWIWGAFKLSGALLGELHALWCARGRRDPYVGTLVNEYLERGGSALAVKAGSQYFDVGTLDGYRHAMHLLGDVPQPLEARGAEP